MPLMLDYANTHKRGSASTSLNWMNKNFSANQSVKLDLYRRYGILAAAGDRHLVEFCPGSWYLHDKDTVEDWEVKLTTVDWRKENRIELNQIAEDIVSGVKPLEIKATGEEGVNQMCALLGLGSYVTNVNIPNYGQIPNLPLGAVVETNAYFSGNSVVPLFAGEIPEDVNHLIIRHVYNQEEIVKCTLNGDYKGVFKAFINDPNVDIPLDKAKELFDKMIENTKEYLPFYEKYKSQQN